MNSRINEDLAWLRVQDMQREAENRRLMAPTQGWSMSAAKTAKIGLRVVRTLAGFMSRTAAAQPKAPSVASSRHHG